jgi:FMN-dependent NADH-azoreductase
LIFSAFPHPDNSITKAANGKFIKEYERMSTRSSVIRERVGKLLGMIK